MTRQRAFVAATWALAALGVAFMGADLDVRWIRRCAGTADANARLEAAEASLRVLERKEAERASREWPKGAWTVGNGGPIQLAPGVAGRDVRGDDVVRGREPGAGDGGEAMKPSKGRIVFYMPPLASAYPGEPFPGIVTRVDDLDMVGMTVFYPHGEVRVVNVIHDESATPAGNTWHWPPRV